MKGDASETETNTMQQQQQKHLGQHQSTNRPKKEIAFNGSRQDLAPEATPAHGTIQVPERATAKERKEKAKAKAKAKEKEKAKAKAKATAKEKEKAKANGGKARVIGLIRIGLRTNPKGVHHLLV